MLRKILKNKRLKIISTSLKKAETNFYLLVHKTLNKLKGKKPEHVIIVGPARSGTTLLYNMCRHSVSGEIYAPGAETPAVASLKKFSSAYLTKRPLDLFEVDKIIKLLGPIRDLKFIITVRDPRSLVTSFHKSIPFQYYQSWDYGFYTGPYPSFTRPGVGKAFAEIEKIKNNGAIKSLIVRYEDLVSNPESIKQKIEKYVDFKMEKNFSYFHRSDIPETLKIQFNSVRPVDSKNAERWKNKKYQKRLSLQFKLFPEIKTVIEKYGYVMDGFQAEDVKIEKGTVVAMHTPDDVYRNEARRMQASMDRLGIKHFIEELPPVEQLAGVDNPDDYPKWFLQKLARFYKPTWLVEKRKQLRGPILYCDVDAFFHRDPWPYLNLYDGDIAVFSRRNGIVNSATIWMNDTPNAVKILKDWARRGQEKREEVLNSWPNVVPSTSDQPLLRDIVQENYHASKFFIQRLPQTMLYIFQSKYKTEKNEVFIEQLQASRVAKSKSYHKTKNGQVSPRDQRIAELEGLL